MKIKEMLSQHRRDFLAIFICEHCEYEEEVKGYDDENYHVNVIPNMNCPECNKKSKADYAPRETKYPQGFVI